MLPTVPTEGSIWRRRPPGREVVEVGRVWFYTGGWDNRDHGWAIRTHPRRGGNVTIWWPEDFARIYELVSLIDGSVS